MSEESKSADAKSASGLHATAAPFVPVAPKNEKGSEGKAGVSKPDASASAGSSHAAGAAINGTSPPTGQAAGDKSSTTSTAAAAGNQTAGNLAKAGNTAGKAKAGAKQSGATSSKLAAAASAAPFVPGKQGTPASQGPAAAPAKEGKQQGGKQGGKGGKQQQQQQQQAKQQQQQQQQQRGQQLQQQKEQQKEQQQKDPKEQKDKDQKENSEQQKEQQKDAKDVSKAPAKMSAAAAAFVPKSAPSTPSAPAASGTSTPAGANNSQQQQQSRVQPPASAAARLKSPLKGGTAAASSSSSSTPAATHASPARATGASSGRGGRGPRGEPPGSRGSSLAPGGPGMMSAGAGAMYGGAGGFGGGRSMPAGLPGLGGGPGGPKRALLAQFQGNYQYPGGAGGFGGYPHQQHHHHHGSGAGKQLLSGQFMTEGLRQQLQQSNYLKQLQYTPSNDEVPLPDKIAHYHTLYPLEDLAAADSGGVSSAWGVRTSILKGISARDGKAYALRVVCGKQVIPSLEMMSVVRSAVDAWSCLTGHPGLLVPLEGLVASELDGSPSLVVVHAYIPGAVTMAQAHLHPTQTASGQLVRNTPSEDLLWSYTVQLAGVLRAAHASGLALRPAALTASKVLVTPVGRLKVSGLGVAEALTGEVVPASSEDLLQLQRDDVVAMGQLLLQLACAVGSLPAPSLDFASLHFSQDFVRLLMLLLGVADGGAFSWRAVSALLGERLLLEMDSLAMFNEQLLDDLGQEMENGRLLRLMAKLSFVTDRAPEGPGHGGPADTGDRYLLQLFRDFAFHQGELEGGRVLDWGHLVECLNKLDAGVSEHVLLQSRDERSLLVVSYADIKRCVEAAISELRTRGGNSQAAGVGSLMRPHPGAGVGHMYGMAGR